MPTARRGHADLLRCRRTTAKPNLAVRTVRAPRLPNPIHLPVDEIPLHLFLAIIGPKRPWSLLLAVVIASFALLIAVVVPLRPAAVTLIVDHHSLRCDLASGMPAQP